MGLDIRIPIGLMFVILGLFLIVCGLSFDRSIYGRSLGINVNLWWGIVLLIFGALMYTFGRKGGALGPYRETKEGEIIEEIEHEEGLESEEER